MDWWVWLIIAIVVVVVVAVAAIGAKRGVEARQHDKAESLREGARADNVEVQRKQAEAMEARMQAEELEQEAARDREGVRESLQRADEMDPNVDDSEARPQ